MPGVLARVAASSPASMASTELADWWGVAVCRAASVTWKQWPLAKLIGRGRLDGAPGAGHGFIRVPGCRQINFLSFAVKSSTSIPTNSSSRCLNRVVNSL